MKNTIHVCLVMALALFASSHHAWSAAKLSFQTDAITVSQSAGAVNVPVVITPEIYEDQPWFSDYGGIAYYYTSNGSAISGTHYTGVELVEERTIQLTTPDENPFVGSISIPIAYTGSTIDRTFAVSLADYPGEGTDLGAITSCTVTILAEPVRPPIYFSLGAATYTVNQTAGAIQIPVNYTGTSYDSQVSINYRTINGTANGTDDFLGVSGGVLNYATGSNSAFIVIPVYLTKATEDKTFTVQIFDPSEGQTTTLSTASVTIKGIPAPPPIQFKFGSGNYRVNQTSGAISIPITYTGTPRNSEIWVEYNTQNISGTSGTHYGGTNSSVVNFASGSKTAYLTIPIYYSGSTSNRTFRVNLASMSEGVKVTPSSAVVTIQKQKGPPTIVFKTKRVSVGKRVIEGRIINVPLKDIKRVKVNNLGNTYKVIGKTKWKTKGLNFRRSGTYPFTATAVLRNGTTITQTVNIIVR